MASPLIKDDEQKTRQAISARLSDGAVAFAQSRSGEIPPTFSTE